MQVMSTVSSQSVTCNNYIWTIC